MRDITRFCDEFDFLSNFYPCEISFEGLVYPTAEHAYQAAKTIHEPERIEIRDATTPGRAKRLGRNVTIRDDWNSERLQVMEVILNQKFSNPILLQRLLATEDAQLIEGNDWGDQFWGVSNGRGENHLGRLLMKIRDRSR